MVLPSSHILNDFVKNGLAYFAIAEVLDVEKSERIMARGTSGSGAIKLSTIYNGCNKLMRFQFWL